MEKGTPTPSVQALSPAMLAGFYRGLLASIISKQGQVVMTVSRIQPRALAFTLFEYDPSGMTLLALLRLSGRDLLGSIPLGSDSFELAVFRLEGEQVLCSDRAIGLLMARLMAPGDGDIFKAVLSFPEKWMPCDPEVVEIVLSSVTEEVLASSLNISAMEPERSAIRVRERWVERRLREVLGGLPTTVEARRNAGAPEREDDDGFPRPASRSALKA